MDVSQPLFQKVIEAFKANQFKAKEVQAYLGWIKAYMDFTGLQNPDNIKTSQVKEFLRHLSEERGLMPSEQKQAYIAINFFYDKVLNRSLWTKNNAANTEASFAVEDEAGDYRRDNPSAESWINHLQEPYRLIAQISHQSGLQLEEVLNLRFDDVHINSRTLHVRDRLGNVSQIEIAESLLQPISLQLAKAKKTFQQDCKQGTTFVRNPNLAQRRTLTSNSRWYFLFPGSLQFHLATQKRVREALEHQVVKQTLEDAKQAAQRRAATNVPLAATERARIA